VSLKRVVHARVGARWMVDDHQGKETLCIALEAAMFSFLQTNTPIRTYNRGGDEKVDPVTPDSDAECGVPPSTFTDMH